MNKFTIFEREIVKNKSRYIIVLLLLTLASGATAALAQSGTTLKHPAKRSRHSTKAHKIAVVRPAVIDTTSLDTTDRIHQNFIKEINRWSSVRYKKGGVTLKGADCSGFVLKVFEHSLTMELPRTSREQAKIGDAVDKDELQFGDLVFFYKNPRRKIKHIGHVGIYIGDGNFVHSSKHKGVGVDALSEHYFSSHFAEARRVVDLTPERQDVESATTAE